MVNENEKEPEQHQQQQDDNKAPVSLIPDQNELMQFPHNHGDVWMDAVQQHTGGVLGKIEIEHIS